MKKGDIAITAIVLAAVGVGYVYKLLTGTADISFTITFMILLLILYALLKNVKLD